MSHYFPPKPVVDNKKTKWEFKCRYCACVRRVPRTLQGPNIEFEDEKPRPRLQNLATHLTECSKKKEAERTGLLPETLEAGSELNLQASAKIMEEFLREGALNPAIEPTVEGFHRIFAAWILDESLPWTTGEAPTLRALFQYVKCRFPLPSDTTVRNKLDVIFQELHAKVVAELNVSCLQL